MKIMIMIIMIVMKFFKQRAFSPKWFSGLPCMLIIYQYLRNMLKRIKLVHYYTQDYHVKR